MNIQLNKEQALLLIRMINFFLRNTDKCSLHDCADAEPAKKVKNILFKHILAIDEGEQNG